MAENDHGHLIAVQAKSVLVPLGFQRRSRSRLWWRDQGYWLSVIEFQPSSFSSGTYCNVAAHWLWNPRNFLSFDYGLTRVGSYAGFTNSDRFADDVHRMALGAAQLADSHRRRLESLQATAAATAEVEADLGRQGRGGEWSAFHAGVASGLIGEAAQARDMFERVLASGDGDVAWQVARASLTRQLLAALDRQHQLREVIQKLVDARRADEKLPAYVLPSLGSGCEGPPRVDAPPPPL